METRESLAAEVEFLDACLADIHKRAGDAALTEEQQSEFDAGVELRAAKRAALKVIEERHAALERLAADKPENIVPGTFHAPAVHTRNEVPSLNDLSFFATPGEVRDAAMRSIERSGKISDDERGLAEATLARAEMPDGRVARHVIATGAPEYRTAWSKLIQPGGAALLTSDEARAVEAVRAASLSGSAGGYAVPFTLDPTIIYTGNGAANPFREISRVVQVATDDWNGVSSAGITVSWDGEAAEVSDDAPTLAQPSITTRKAQGFVPFSIEIGQDWPGMEAEIRAMFQKSKDVAEATVFATGASGSNQPIGIVTALTATSSVINEASSETFTVADIYALENALPPEYEQGASFLANKAIYNLIRQFDNNGGADLWTTLGAGQPGELIGYPARRASAMDSAFDAAATANNYILILGDFSNYVIVDRVGLSVELVPHLFATANNLPSGQRGLYAYWRVGADSVNDNAFRMLNLDTAA